MDKPLQSLRIEKIKTATLVVLFLTTILLLSFFWKNISLEGLPFAIRSMGDTTPRVVLSAQQVLLPQKVEVNFGSGAYTESTGQEKEVWEALVGVLTQISQGETVLLEEITPEQYQKVMEFRSIRADFGYSIPFQDLCKQYQIKRHQSMEGVQRVSSMSFSTGSPESFLLVDAESGRYYRLVADQPLSPLSSLVDEIEAGGFTPYYEASTFFGVDNRTRMPVTLQTGLTQLPYETEFTTSEADKIRALAESFFGSSFDFIRKITESDGSVVYLYGYGQKLFTLDQSGILEYKEDLAPAADEEQDFFASLDLALQYLSFHGPALGEDQALQLTLHKSTSIERGGNRGYRFVFGATLQGEKIFYASGSPLIIEIIGKQVVYFYRDLFWLPKDELERVPELEKREAYSIANVLANNYRLLSEILVKEGKLGADAKQASTFETIVDRITEVHYGYLKQSAGKDGEQAMLVPVWAVTIQGICFYFDIDDATALGYTVVSTGVL